MKPTSPLKMLAKNRPEQYRHVPLFEYAVGRWTGDVLVWLTLRAKDRGDLHEANHLLAAIMVGNSDHADESTDNNDFSACCVPRDRMFGAGDSIVHMVPVKKTLAPAQS
jgi:hypothetical protein